MITRMDRDIGRILDELKTLGIEQDTLVFFASDNGGLHVLEFPGTPSTHNTPFRTGKGYNYEGGLRVPLIISVPGQAARLVDMCDRIRRRRPRLQPRRARTGGDFRKRF